MNSARKLLALLAFVLAIATIPHRICEREAAAWYEGDPKIVDALGAQVAAWTQVDLAPSTFATGSSRFDGEWHFGTHMMAAMGFGQVAAQRLREPGEPGESAGKMERSLDAMLSPAMRRFDTEAWGEDAIATLGDDDGRGHVAYLGYTGLALGLHRTLRPESRFAEMGDRIALALTRRLEASPVGLIETYPGEVYPVDNTAAFAAIALHARATGRPVPAVVARGLQTLRTKALDPKTGLLVQAVRRDDGSPRDRARASGTALASYFLAYADEETSSVLFRALEREQMRTVLGFGAMLEYAGERGSGDIDSGPIAFGFGVSATGFALGASRVHRDRDTFTALYATTHLFGAPFDEDGSRTHTTGGPLGDAILFAMMTAPQKGGQS